MSTEAQEPAASPISVVIVGMGGRASIYSAVALTNPELLNVVGVVAPSPIGSVYAIYHPAWAICIAYSCYG